MGLGHGSTRFGTVVQGSEVRPIEGNGIEGETASRSPAVLVKAPPCSLNNGMSTESLRVNPIKQAASQAISSLSYAISADLIIMGTDGRTGIRGLLIGNEVENVPQTTRALVLAVKPDGFVSPVTLH